MPSQQSTDGQVVIGLAGLAAIVLLYSVLVVQQILLGVIVAVGLAVVYLLWRFVRALERIAAALENGAAAGGTDHDGGAE